MRCVLLKTPLSLAATAMENFAALYGRSGAQSLAHRLPSSTTACFSSTGAPAANHSVDPLKPYIPAWCTLPEVPDSSTIIRSAKFLSGAYNYSQLPPQKYPEVAITGRSNVGKSSLINYLVGSRTVANVSKTPGKTQSINHYLINRSWCLVDCPGYGYAKTSKDTRADWNTFTQQFFKSRSTLTDVLLLVDARLPPNGMDLAGVTWLTSRGVPVTLVFTKIDKHKTKLPSPAQNILDFTAALEAQGGPLAIPPHFATSSTAQIGREPLLKYLAQRRAQHAQQEEQAAMVASQAKQTVAVP
eukprot:GHUV01019722.1.p1 GENE.GHUV01019722.1~~GHUV01019722.1.p1  ORF type:complete len:300 (+),score=67.14 GHUV01019722.1:92-991(+)